MRGWVDGIVPSLGAAWEQRASAVCRFAMRLVNLLSSRTFRSIRSFDMRVENGGGDRGGDCETAWSYKRMFKKCFVYRWTMKKGFWKTSSLKKEARQAAEGGFIN